MQTIDLKKLGWDDFFEKQLSPKEVPNTSTCVVARIVEPSRGMSKVICSYGEIWADYKEKKHTAGPSVGDWVLGSVRSLGGSEKRLTINRILTRKNKLSRNAPGGKKYEQILCTNVELAFLVIALNQELNLSSVERYLALIKENEIPLVILLTKADQGSKPKATVDALSVLAPNDPIHPISVKDGIGLSVLPLYFEMSKTVVLLGASGAGKSTIVNYLLESKAQKVEEVREKDQKGRHTTTNRKLYSIPSGGMLIDSPGIREIQKWEQTEKEIPVKQNKKIKSFGNSRMRRSQQEE